MDYRTLEYTGERLIPNDERLKHLLVRDMALFHFANQYAISKVVLDAGCGAGEGTNFVACNGADYVVGVDLSFPVVAYAHARHTQRNLGFCAMDVGWLGFRDHTFDLVTSIEVIEHLHDAERYVIEICRVLKSNGVLVLSTPNKYVSSCTPGTLWPYHTHEFYPEELYALLARYFSSVEMWGLCIPIYEQHPIRRLVHWLAPICKPILPHQIRTSFLPMLQRRIKSDLTIADISISRDQIEKKDTVIAVCHV